MYKLTPNQLLLLNKKIIGVEQKKYSQNQIALIDEISELPYCRNKEQELLYKGPIENAVKLGHEIILKKPFGNADRETAAVALLTFLELNAVKLSNYKNDIDELYHCMEDQNLEKTHEWIRSHIDES